MTTIFMIAGEPSGDVLGGRLMVALKRQSDSPLRFIGVGGDRMIGEGLDSLFDMRELSVMGYFEVIPKIIGLLARIRETVEAARAGSEAAWQELFDAHYPRLFRYFRSRVPSHETAEDLASETFTEAFRSISRFRWRNRPFEAWMFGIARNRLA
ncbi:MAG: hypothetical protein IIC08_04290, partial [Proteobacteria bacterium]|nr:hypothetical protein [Pseudomonadota bacterium]